ncbi:MAG TPA: PAS domain-containing protein, partial [Rhodospirillaceae bacterium]|nr:PAS domain-containing protein [Rhodospirillaceae bacterium]
FIELPEISCQFPHFAPEAGRNPTETVCVEKMCADGRILEIHIGPMPDGGMVSTYNDITERKQAELAFRDSEYRIRLITDAVPALIAYVDSEQRYRFTNQPYEEWFGRPRSTINGQLMSDVLGTELYEARRHFAEQALAGQRVTFEIDLTTAGGRIRFALATYVPHFGPGGVVLGFFAMIQDITERRMAAEEIREAKENLERRVAERTIELTAVNRQLSQEIDERRLAEEALRLAKAEAEQANMSKTKFIAGASHDLLQPLNAARVFTETVAGSRLGPRNRGLVANLSLALQSLEDLLSTLLDISKLDAGALQPDICDFRLDDLLMLLANETAPQAKAKGLALRWVGSSAVVRSDPLLITRVLRNFLSNAIRYTPGGTILLGCRRQRGMVEIQVLDSGTGIPEEKLGLIFEEFQRLAADPQGNDGGMGLGLAIVERIARLLDHRIVVRSAPGRGSLFGITLPLGDVARLRPHAPAVDTVARLDRVRGIRVMVVENDRAERIAMQALLQSWHCEVEVVGSGAAALGRLRSMRQRPDVVVADFHLDAEETGLQVLNSIHAFYRQPVPGIILTADRTSEILDAVREGGYQFLNKPLKPARLRSLLAHFAERNARG